MKKILTIIILVLFFFFLVYQLKNLRGVDLFESFSLSETLPVKTLDKPKKPEPIIDTHDSQGIIIQEDFEDGLVTGGWENLWTRDPGTVIRRITQDEEEGSKHLFVRNLGHQDWAIQHDKLISVSDNDNLYYQARIKTTDDARAGLSVVLYDQDKQVLEWMYAAKMVKQQNKWTKLKNSFLIPEGVKFIRIRLTGSGKGKIYADDILFKKIKRLEKDNKQDQSPGFSFKASLSK